MTFSEPTVERKGGVPDVLRRGLCVGCGACAVIDDRRRMGLNRRGQLVPDAEPNADADAVCPFSDHAPDEDALATDLGFDSLPHDKRLGYVDSLWAGHAIEGEYRARGSSGGLLTWMLVEVLRSTAAETVVHVHPAPTSDDDRLFRFGVSRSAEEVLNNAKTRYYPVTFDEAIKTARHEGKPFIFVGVPCHVTAFNALCRKDPVLKELTIARFSLICGHLKTVNFAKSLAVQLGVDAGRISAIDFRRKLPDRPSNSYGVAVTGANGNEIVSPMSDVVGRDWGCGFFRLEACNFCDDVVGETADISFGDAWLPHYVTDPDGTSIVISRRPAFTALLTAALTKGRISLEAVDADQVAESQAAGLRDRRDGLQYRLWLAARKGLWTPRKRVEARRDHLSRMRRLQLRLRFFVSHRSHKSWWFAKHGMVSLYVAEMQFWEKFAALGGQLKRTLRR